jgi:hypothetical protein
MQLVTTLSPKFFFFRSIRIPPSDAPWKHVRVGVHGDYFYAGDESRLISQLSSFQPVSARHDSALYDTRTMVRALSS